MGRSMPSSVRAPVIAVGVTLLKALSMSRNAAREYTLLRKLLSILNTREWRAVSVDLPLRYACCASKSRPGDLKGLKEFIAHIMQSGFEMLSILWSSRFSSL